MLACELKLLRLAATHQLARFVVEWRKWLGHVAFPSCYETVRFLWALWRLRGVVPIITLACASSDSLPSTAFDAKEKIASQEDGHQDKKADHATERGVFIALLLTKAATEITVPALALSVHLAQIAIQLVPFADKLVGAVSERAAGC